MAALDTLTDDQRAVLQMLLRRDNSYEDLAVLMKTEISDIRTRARTAIAAIAPDASEIGSARRDEISDFLLGQQTVARFEQTREYLRGSQAGRAWAQDVAATLAPIDSGTLPEIPGADAAVAAPPPEPAAPAPAPPAPPPPASTTAAATASPAAADGEVQRSSQLGGRLIAAGVGLVIAIAIIVALSLGGGKDEGNGDAGTSTTTATRTTAKGAAYNVVAAATLAPPKGVDSTAKGNVAIFQFPATDQYRIGLEATGLPPSSTRGSAYGVWLYSSKTKNQFLGFSPSKVGKDGKLQTVTDLAPNTPNYGAVLLTRETASKPTKPGPIILVGQMVTAEPSQPQSGGTATAPATTTPQTTTTP